MTWLPKCACNRLRTRSILDSRIMIDLTWTPPASPAIAPKGTAANRRRRESLAGSPRGTVRRAPAGQPARYVPQIQPASITPITRQASGLSAYRTLFRCGEDQLESFVRRAERFPATRPPPAGCLPFVHQGWEVEKVRPDSEGPSSAAIRRRYNEPVPMRR